MLAYNHGKGSLENWLITETEFSPDALGKCESIMYLGNGYMGLRSATEEPYLHEVRNLFVNGTFNRFGGDEVTELPNLADVTRIDLRIDGERFSLEFGGADPFLRLDFAEGKNLPLSLPAVCVPGPSASDRNENGDYEPRQSGGNHVPFRDQRPDDQQRHAAFP